MRDRINAIALDERLRAYGSVAYAQVTSLMMGGIFALAALVLLDIVRTPDLRVLRLSFWAMAVGGEIVALVVELQRPALFLKSGMEDVPLLVLRGLCELFMLALIAPQYGGPDGWRYTYLVAIVFAAFSLLLARSFVRGVQPQDFSNNVQPIVTTLVGEHRRLYLRALLIPVVLSGMSVVTLFGDAASPVTQSIALAYNLVATGFIALSLQASLTAWRSFEIAVAQAASESK